jgi:hypothetical protein
VKRLMLNMREGILGRDFDINTLVAMTGMRYSGKCTRFISYNQTFSSQKNAPSLQRTVG